MARPRGLLTVRACWWAIEQIRREHASVAGVARQLACSWKTVWRSIRPLLEALDADPARFDGVATLGVDEHVWHHVSPLKRGPKELTGMVDLTRHPDPKDPDKLIVRARLLDLIPGRSGTVYRNWLIERGDAFRAGVQVATLDPFHGYKNAIDDQLDEVASVLDAFHVVKLGGQALHEISRRVQQAIHGHRGRKGDPLCGIPQHPAPIGARIPTEPYVITAWRKRHPIQEIPDGHVFTQPWPAGPTDRRKDHTFDHQYKHDRARRTLKGIDEQVTKAERAVAGTTPVKRNRFVQLTGGSKSVNRALEAKARSLAGLKGYAEVAVMPTGGPSSALSLLRAVPLLGLSA
ncbi:ISL3 family transposase [Humibacillus xanthopallidus]|uniref:ISL3 family transposase n=1 Tax=Humibacillus xanthopallidus TaxID=412689 RepID=UPI003CCC5287